MGTRRASAGDGGVAGFFAPVVHAAERLQRFADWLVSPRALALACAGVVGLGTLIGLLLVYVPDAEAVRELERYQPSIHSVLYDDAGRPFDEWVIEKREPVIYSEVPEHLRHAVLATEDSRFFSHPGIDPIGVLRAIWRNITRGFGEEGASTITMQLSRQIWLDPEKSLTRKALEAFFYSLQTERYYSKERIFELYASQSFLGHNVYGFATAADYYFGVEMDDLTLAQAALLAGMLQRPSDYNVNLHPEEEALERARRRRALVLGRMVDEGYISEEEAERADAEPIAFVDRSREDEVGAYFVEEIRKNLFSDYRGEIYSSGLQIYTTLDRRVQEATERALQTGLRRTDKSLGWRRAQPNLLELGEDPATYRDRDWRRPLRVGGWTSAVVMEVTPQRATLRIGDQTTALTPEQAAWTRRDDLTELMAEGDLISVGVTAIGEDGALSVELDQEPEIQGAILVVENVTGEVKALVGGRKFDNSEFNRAVQAKRQTGSAFKPFVYATALREGWTASDLILDEPKSFSDPSTGQPYEPSNYENHYVGITTIAEALAKSRNVVTVELQQKVGAHEVIETARDLGITANLQPYLSLSLGVIDASLWEMTRAYAVFPNGGVRVEPHLVKEVRDRQGRPVEVFQRQATSVIDNDVAYLMTRMLTNVVEYCADGCQQGGTGRRARPLARELGLDLGGKTGTTDDYSDAWFLGFSPYHTIGVWVGNDTKKPIGPGQEGARVALPIWMDVMRAASEGLPPREFEPPANVEIRTVDPHTGMLVGEYCTASIDMAYIAGTEPTAVCGPTEHEYLGLPYYQQGYFIDRILRRQEGQGR